jgi:hypothetical protein
MKTYEAAATIHASPDRIWEVLADVAGYPGWESGITRVDGRLGPGEKIKLYSEVDPERAFPLKVTEFEPGRRMTWQGGMPIPALFKGVRTFTLTPEGDGATRFHVREQFTGLMSPLITRSMPDLQPSFDRFARGLKAQAESAG